MDDDVARLDHRQEQGGDRRHAAGKGQRILGLVPDRQAVLQNFLVRPVEARIDQPVGAARTLAGHALEMALAGGGIGKDEGRGQEDRRLQRSFGQDGIEAIAHHQRRGLELAIADAGRLARTLGHLTLGQNAGQIGFGWHDNLLGTWGRSVGGYVPRIARQTALARLSPARSAKSDGHKRVRCDGSRGGS